MALQSRIGVDRLFRQADWLDRVADVLQGTVRSAFTGTGPIGIGVRNTLNGVWLGHPLHAAISDVPVGMFTGALLLDYIGLFAGRSDARRAAGWCVGLGVGGALATALAGLADYSEVENPQRRQATGHALLNVLGTLVFAVSLLRRRGGDWRGAIPFSTLGYALILAGGDLGGHLVFNWGTLVSREAFASPPEDFTPVLAAADLGEGQLKRVEANGMGILLARVGGRVYAIGDTCTHWGCSLAEGRRRDATVQCACHGSIFNLTDGSVRQGPASEPELSFAVRERDGQIEVRLSPTSSR